MSEQNQASVAEAVATEVAEQSATPANPHEQLVEHLKQYPLAVSAKESVASIPRAKEISDFVSPKVQTIKNVTMVRGVLDKGDLLADSALNELDKYVPSLKTLEVTDLTNPITRPINGALESAHNTWDTVNTSIQKSIIEPSTKAVNDLRKQLHLILKDSNGKAVLVSSSDPLVAPINENLQKAVQKVFPNTKTVSDKHSSELSRTARILHNAVFRIHGAVDSNETAVPGESSEQAQQAQEAPVSVATK